MPPLSEAITRLSVSLAGKCTKSLSSSRRFSRRSRLAPNNAACRTPVLRPHCRTLAYRGETGPDYDELLDTVAAVCAADDPVEVARLYGHDHLRVPADLLR
jgi:hypothetical protein